MTIEMQWLSLNEFKEDTEWWKIYHTSFPAKERDSKKQLLAGLEKNLIKIGRYQKENVTVAIAVLVPMHALPIVFLNYFAVAKIHRGRLLGTALLNSLFSSASHFVSEYSPHFLALVWEVENPKLTQSANKKARQERRIEFYKRIGGELFPHLFIQPAIDGKHTVAMRLMYMAATELNPHLENQIFKTIYFEKYHVINDIPKSILLDLFKQCFI